MPITKIGSKRTLETGTAVLTHPAREFELSVAKFNPTIKIVPGPNMGGGNGLRSVIEVLEAPAPGGEYYEGVFTDGSTYYTLALVVRSYGAASKQVYVVDYTVTT